MRTITLDDPEFAGTYTVEVREDGTLLLEPYVGPSVNELFDEAGARRLTAEEFEREFGHLPSDGEG